LKLEIPHEYNNLPISYYNDKYVESNMQIRPEHRLGWKIKKSSRIDKATFGL